MNSVHFSVLHPKVLCALPLAIPFLLILIFRYKKIALVLKEKHLSFFRIQVCFTLRTLFRALAWIFLICALAGISFGTRSIPVQKSGNAVTFVFDISFSMQAKDSLQNRSRLEAASLYAKTLLENMSGCSVSVVLSKGESFIAIPQTEDFEIVRSLLENISPSLIAKKGSSLGSGIEKAIESFPLQVAQKEHIWIFTDGEETDSSFAPALKEAVQKEIAVSIIGFGSEEGCESFAGDGKTRIFTALQTKKITDAIAYAQGKTRLLNENQLYTNPSFIKAEERGSARILLDSLQNTNGNAAPFLVYETEPKEYSALFTALSILCIVLSVFLGECTIKKKSKALLTFSVFTASVIFTSCSQNARYKQKMLAGKLEYNKKNVSYAIANFLEVKEAAQKEGNTEVEEYALFALASTYLLQNENESASTLLNQIHAEKNTTLQSAVFYNQGILAHRNGEYEKAVEYFKQALLADSSNKDAKINLELSQKENAAQKTASSKAEQVVAHSKEKSKIEESLFSIIREAEKNVWKNHQVEDTEDAANDY